MIGYVMVGTNNLDDAIKFYDKVLEVIGLDRNETIEDDYAAYGAKGTKILSFTSLNLSIKKMLPLEMEHKSHF